MYIHLSYKAPQGESGARQPAERTRHAAATTTTIARPASSLDLPSSWRRSREEQRGGPAAGSWNNTPNRHKTTREPPDLIPPPPPPPRYRAFFFFFFFPRDPDCHAAVISHVTVHQSHGADVALAAGRGWFTNISGEYNYTAPPAEQPYAAWGREERRVEVEEEVWGVEWTLKTAFSFLPLFLPPSTTSNQRYHIKKKIKKSNFQLSGCRADMLYIWIKRHK